MMPREFFTKIVQPNVAEFHRHYTDMRRVHNAINSLDALVAHMYAWCSAEYPKAIEGNEDDTEYRGVLARRSREFSLLLSIAKAQREIRIVQREIPQEDARPFRFGGANLGRTRSGSLQVVVDLDPDRYECVEHIVDSAMAFLETEMARFNI